MKNRFLCLFAFFDAALVLAPRLSGQMAGLHGDYREYRKGVHSGNKFRTTFYNDGYFGAKNQPPDYGGEWPINSGRLYMWDADLFVCSEVMDTDGEVKHIHSTVLSNELNWSIGDRSPSGEPWTFLPLPGFANPDTTLARHEQVEEFMALFLAGQGRGCSRSRMGRDRGTAISARTSSTRTRKATSCRTITPTRNSSSTRTAPIRSRRGLGIRMYTRGFQWSNALVEDVLFVLYDFENIGTTNHDKVVFGYKIGNNMGQTTKGDDGSDDCGAYLLEEDVAYLYDFDNIGDGGFSPVGYFGGAFLESPGNPFDGIDNDGDGDAGSGMVITEDTFAPKTLNAGDPIVLIDYQTFKRTKTTLSDTLARLGSDTLVVKYQDLRFKFWQGKLMQEDPFNLVDDNLNGLIDESNGTIIRKNDQEIPHFLYVGLKAVDYLTGAGLDNPLIDERRDDGIDNDHDWDPLYDDTGADGAPFTHDPGEGDGKPTFGEPHFDKTDIHESDMIGLTSFTLYLYENIPHWDDEKVWQNLKPGYLDDQLTNGNVELLYGSGYFPMPVEHTERFSMSIMCGETLQDMLDNKNWAQKAYDENYNFAKAPNMPTVRAVTGDKRVTLFWDDFAEKSIDPLTGKDFEGYRIYRSTDPGFGDMSVITDGKGLPIANKPLVQFDLINEYEGYSEIPFPGKGVQYWLGGNTGIVHTWTDTTVQNGFTYYYAVTAYDHGDPGKKLAPTETKRVITLGASGEIEEQGPNVVIIRTEATVAGYVAAHFDEVCLMEGGTTTGRIGYEITDAKAVKNEHRYRVTFTDTLIEVNNGQDTLKTKTFSLMDVTETSEPDTLIANSTFVHPEDKQPTTDGFRLKLYNEPYLQVDSAASHWAVPDNLYPFHVQIFTYSKQKANPHVTDFRITFGNVGMDTSVQYYRGRREMSAIPVNFMVTRLPDGDKIPFAFRARDGEDGIFSRGQFSDEIILMNQLGDSLVASWDFSLIASADDSLRRNPRVGDVADIILRKPFLEQDVFEFVTAGPQVDPALAKNQMDRIKVVPNPYVVGNSWEPANPYANGRGPRELHFIHLPSPCTIRIFNSIGQLIKSIDYHNSNLEDGTYIWDMMSRDNLDLAYGIYIYQVDAGDVGRKIGKFAVIK